MRVMLLDGLGALILNRSEKAKSINMPQDKQKLTQKNRFSDQRATSFGHSKRVTQRSEDNRKRKQLVFHCCFKYSFHGFFAIESYVRSENNVVFAQENVVLNWVGQDFEFLRIVQKLFFLLYTFLAFDDVKPGTRQNLLVKGLD
jgi:hypothetical protein